MASKRIYLSSPTMHGKEQEFVKEAFDKNWVAPLGFNVDNFEKEEEINLNELLTEMKQTDDEIKKAQNEVLSCLKDLTSSDQDIMSSLNCLVEMIEG